MSTSLSGEVRVTRPALGPIQAVLSGTDERGRATELALVGNPLAALPDTLHDVRVEVVAGRMRLVSASTGTGFDVTAASVHIHRDLREALSRAIPPRAPPLGRRVLWKLVLTLACSAIGRALLRRLRRIGGAQS